MELLDIIDTDLPATGSVNMNSDKIMIVQGGVLKRTSPNVLRGLAPTGSLPPIAGDVDVTLSESSYATTDSTDNITSVTGLAEGQVFRYEFTENGGDITDGGLLEIQGKGIFGRAAGDVAEFIGKAGGVVKVNYIRKSGAPSRPTTFHCRTISTANVDIANLNNGDSMNGITLATNNVVLLAHETAAATNGLYIIGATAGTTVRHPLFDTFDSMFGVDFVIDEAASFSNAPSVWVCNASPGGVIDVDDLSFESLVTAMGRMDPALATLIFVAGGLWMKGIASAFRAELWFGPTALTANRQFFLDLVDANHTLTIAEGDPTIAETYAKLTPVAFADLPASPTFGMIAAVNDSNHTGGFGDTFAGGDVNQIIAYYDGSDWRIMGGKP